jgi:hypothetical protein
MNDLWPIPGPGARRILVPSVSTLISELNVRITPMNADVGFRMVIIQFSVWRPGTKEIRICKENRLLNSVPCLLGLCLNYARTAHRDPD